MSIFSNFHSKRTDFTLWVPVLSCCSIPQDESRETNLTYNKCCIDKFLHDRGQNVGNGMIRSGAPFRAQIVSISVGPGNAISLAIH